MTRKTLIVGIILLLALAVVPATFAQGVDPEGDEDGTEFSCDIGLFEHPVIARIADSLDGYEYEDVCDIFREGAGDYEGVVGLGRIMTAIRLEEQFQDSLGWTWEELLEWQLAGNGWGQLRVAAKLAGQIEGVDAQELLDMRAADEGVGWGQIRQQYRDELKGGPPCGTPPCGGPNASNATSQNANMGGPGNGRGNGPPPHSNAGGNRNK